MYPDVCEGIFRASRVAMTYRHEGERNPFTLPSDEEVFRMRDSERRMKSLSREKQATLKVWEKSTGSVFQSSKASELLDGMGGDVDAVSSAPPWMHGAAQVAIMPDCLPSSPPPSGQPLQGPTAKREKTRALMAAAKTVLGSSGHAAPEQSTRKPEKENMAEFIAKKREMFLVQMSLDTKREEIRKLEEKAAMKEDALKKSEQMLEEDAIRFDTFLKENDKKAHDAIKHAERETKLKQDKVGSRQRVASGGKLQ